MPGFLTNPKTSVLLPIYGAPKSATQQSITFPSTEKDGVPFASFTFALYINNLQVAVVQKIDKIAVDRAIETITSGGESDRVYNFIGRINYGALNISGLATQNLSFYNWVINTVGSGHVTRHNISITQQKTDGKKERIYRTWTFYDAFPKSWSISSFAIGTLDKPMMESVSFAFSRMEGKMGE